MANPLSGSNKTNISAIETALNTAINALNTNDNYQGNALQVLRRMRRMLEQIKVERSQ